MSPGRIRAEDLSAAQRRELGVSRSTATRRGKGGGTTAGALVCHACAERLVGPAAVAAHRDTRGHRRYDLELDAPATGRVSELGP